MIKSNILDNFYQVLEKNVKQEKDSVVVITRNGVVLEESLENKPYNHAILTCYMAVKFGLPYIETNFPIVAGNYMKRNGFVVLQVHKIGNCIGYFPDNVTKFQYSALENWMNENQSLIYQYEGCEQVEGFVSSDNVKEYVKMLINNDSKKLDIGYNKKF